MVMDGGAGRQVVKGDKRERGKEGGGKLTQENEVDKGEKISHSYIDGGRIRMRTRGGRWK